MKNKNLFTKITRAFARTLIFLLSVIVCIPLILLPQATAVPVYVWIPLGITTLALLVLQFRLAPAPPA